MGGKLLVGCWFLLLSVAFSAPSEDEVHYLPLYGTPPTPQWSGFLNASYDGTAGTFLHYWFAEAESNPSTAPVVLWLNGGPGESSIVGMLSENGPLIINATGGLMENPYAWTKLANLLILDSPAGVGYSYCAASVTGGSCSNTDKSTAKDSQAALEDFFVNKFPELLTNPFYITGESYAGVYIPTLAAAILENSGGLINLKGIAVGDPCTDNAAQQDSMDMLWYGHKYGFVPDSEFDFLWNNCSLRKPHPLAQGRWGAAATKTTPFGDLSAACTLAHRKFLLSTSRGFSQSWTLAWLNDVTLFGPAATTSFNQAGSLNFQMTTYMNRADVRQQLHVEDSPGTAFGNSWPGPNQGWSYTSDYAACNPVAPPGTPSMIQFYGTIAPQLEVTAVYNGDADPCVSYEGTRAAILEVGFSEVEGGSYRPWFFNSTASTLSLLEEKPLLFGPSLSLQEAGPQVGGMVVDYENNLSFITVHGSGHMVPQFRPRAALYLLDWVLNGKQQGRPLAPFTARDSVLSALSDDDFDTYLDKWTTAAKAGAAKGTP